MASDLTSLTPPDKIDKAYVDALAQPLTRFMGEPPHDPLTVLALATRAALYEALEMIELGEIGLKRAADGAHDTRADSLPFEMDCHGRIYAGTKVIRRVKEALDLFRPGPLSTPAERVLASRSRMGLNQPKLAKLAGCDRAHLSHIERGTRPLTPQMAAGLARPLGVTAEYLLTGKDPSESRRPAPGGGALQRRGPQRSEGQDHDPVRTAVRRPVPELGQQRRGVGDHR